ncbi:MAG: hypothetical protein ACTSVI_15350 [Promethearchaeota archaeon]
MIIYHCRDCGYTEKRVTGKEYSFKQGIEKTTFQQQIDLHYRIDDLLREKWKNFRDPC